MSYIGLGRSSWQAKYAGNVRPAYEDAVILRFLRDSSERRINNFRVFRAALDLGRKSGCSIYIIDNNNDIYHGRCTVRQMYEASIPAQSGPGAPGGSAFWSFHHSHGESFMAPHEKQIYLSR
jgi:hypothetical protein